MQNTPQLTPERVEKMRTEVDALRQLIASLDRDRASVPRLGLTALVSVPAGIVWGPVAVLLSLAGTAVLVATAFYIIAVRRNEYCWNLKAIEAQLETLPKT